MAKIDWEIVSNYMETVGTTLKNFPFNKPQEYIKVTNRGKANISYTIGTQTGTLTPGSSVEVSEVISTFSLTSVSGTQFIEVYAKENGTEKEETLVEANHTHFNKTVIDALSDNAGVLQYKGQPIQGGTGGSGIVFENWADGELVQLDTTVADTTAPVLTITPASSFVTTKTVTMSTNETATIWYTLDDSDPISSGTRLQYSSPITLTETDTIKAYAVDSSNNASAVQTITYTKDAGAPAEPQVLVYDTFTRANSATLGVTETGNKTWVEPIDAFSIESNKVRCVSSGSLRRAYVDVAPTNIEISTTVTFGTYAAIIFRHTSETNGFFFKTGLGNTMLGAYKDSGSATTLTPTNSFVPTGGQIVTLKVRIQGDNIKCYIDDTLYFDITDNFANTVNNVGFLAHNDSTTLFDEFKVMEVVA